MRETDVAAATDEYEALFLGLGRSEIMLYGSFYLAGYLNEKPLAALRGDLARLGLARDETRSETEDHIAHGLEVMRYLIAGDDLAVSNLEQQRRFFRDAPAALGRRPVRGGRGPSGGARCTGPSPPSPRLSC